MESSDLSAYLNELSGLDAKLPLESSLQEFSSLIIPEQPVIEDQSNDSLVDLNTFSNGVSTGRPLSSEIGFDALLSPPDSPEQVTPVIKLDFPSESVKLGHSLDESVASVTDQNSSLLVSEDIILDELDFSQIGNVESSVCLGPVVELIGSPLSADDVDSLFSVSEPTSPTIESFDKSSNVIKASPELYKIISTSSLDVSRRISPYPKGKPKKDSRSPPQRRSPAQPVPEHIILEQVNKKDRKKLQNKNAAIRYRQKKKDEAMGIKSEEQLLEEENIDLKTKVDDLEREIKYMKNLMQDIYKAKGIVF